jgi:hypothetical protein
MIGACDRGDPRIKKQRLPNSLRLHFCPRHLFFGDWRVVSGIKDSRGRATPPFGKAWILTTQGAPAIDIIHHVDCLRATLLFIPLIILELQVHPEANLLNYFLP